MEKSKGTSIFQIKAKNLKQGNSWSLEFDDSLVPKRPNPCWKLCIGSTSARFSCTKCGRGWPSVRVKVVFHMRLLHGHGTVKVKPLGQQCKTCEGAPMEKPSVTSRNIDILLDNLVEKIRIKCYHEDLVRRNKPFISHDVSRPHEPAHCEACTQGICTRR
nr:receptor-transporting protein 3 [Dicentrarchus labrax]